MKNIKNTYLTGYLPFVSILLFSLSLSIFIQSVAINLLKKVGLYAGVLELFTETELKLAVILAMTVLFFMVFSALKVLADTVNELSLLFFSKDSEGELLKKVRTGSLIFLGGGLLSLLSFSSLIGIIAIFLLTTIGYLIYFAYKLSPSLTTANLIGLVVFQVVVWLAIGTTILLVGMKIYNSLMTSLPL